MLLYQYCSEAFEELWKRFSEGELSEDELLQLPKFAENVAPYAWYVEQRLKLADELVAACPEESWAWYELAMLRFEYGDWENGLADLSSGNLARNNRLPLPFPVSFVIQRLAAEQNCGSEVVAGLVGTDTFAWLLPNFIRLKDQAKNQVVRLNCGASLHETDPWHLYTCRYGSMDGASTTQWLVAYILRGILLKYLLVETPESFTVEQRDALWGLYHRGRRIREIARYDMRDAQPSFDELDESLISICEKHGLNYEFIDYLTNELIVPEASATASRELLTAYYRWNFKYLEAEFGKLSRDVRARFRKLSEFDFATYSWSSAPARL